MSTVTTLTGICANTGTDWFNMCREVCTARVSNTRPAKAFRSVRDVFWEF